MTRRGSLVWALPLWLIVTACGSEKTLHGHDAAVIIPPRDSGPAADAAADGAIMSCDAPKFLQLTTRKEGTHLRVGWTGLAHSTPMPDGASFTVKIFDCDEECRSCRISGPVRVEGDPVINQRCVANPKLTCTADSDCGMHGRCRFFFNATTEIKIPGTDVNICSRLAFEPPTEAQTNGSRDDTAPIQGSVDLTTGNLRFNQFSLLIQQGACRPCYGDTTPRDGILDGTCGVSFDRCDAINRGENTNDSYGYECDWGPGILGIILAGRYGEFQLDVTSRTAAARTGNLEWTLGADSPNCGGAPSDKCFCGHCADSRPCHVDGDCPVGACLPNNSERPNGCDSGVNFLALNPVDCPTSGPNYDAASGTNTCTVQLSNVGPEIVNTPCFTDNGNIGGTLRAQGHAEPFDENGESHPVMAALICAPPTADSSINDLTGFPGPTVVELQFDAKLIKE